MKIAVVGAGGWGTALAGMLGQKHDRICLWARRQSLAEMINLEHKNEVYLPNVELPPNVYCTNDLELTLKNAEIVVIATPSHAVRATVKEVFPNLSDKAIIVSVAKGFEVHSLKRLSEIITEEIPHAAGRIAVLSGPNHAEEVGRQFPTTSVVAALSKNTAEFVQEVFMMPYFRVYTNPDVVGVEIGGALKNIIAVGTGMVEGLGFGDNTRAALITRGIAEMTRLGVVLKANPLTFSGLAGIGDLVATCTGKYSRNRQAGILFAQGLTAQEIQAKTNMVVEGIKATQAAYLLAQKFNVEMPITKELYEVIYDKKSPKQAVVDLMLRGRTHETEEVIVQAALDWHE